MKRLIVVCLATGTYIGTGCAMQQGYIVKDIPVATSVRILNKLTFPLVIHIQTNKNTHVLAHVPTDCSEISNFAGKRITFTEDEFPLTLQFYASNFKPVLLKNHPLNEAHPLEKTPGLGLMYKIVIGPKVAPFWKDGGSLSFALLKDAQRPSDGVLYDVIKLSRAHYKKTDNDFIEQVEIVDSN